MSRRPPLPDRHGVIRIATMLVVMALLLALPGTALAQDGELVPVSGLLEDGARFDNVTITVEGELIGDYGFRDDGVMWTQINDDSYARDALVDGGPRTGANVGIGVRMPSTLGENLDPVGGYRLEGPLVQLTGVWRYHDPNRGGESYLDVAELLVLETGRRLEEGPDWTVFALGVLLLGISLVMWRRNRHLTADRH
ncbi:MAG: hypothetical protein M3096_03165 [Actinomycetia bacterium]|nr:hypothetical protein [Actinomycetes bacterium]